MTSERHHAMLLLGPTGSGKTPLGRQIERRGLGGQMFVHFDFGENLRRIVAQQSGQWSVASGQCTSPLTPRLSALTLALSQRERGPCGNGFSTAEIEFLRGVLESGVLLEDEHFYLAERILRGFLDTRTTDAKTWVALNGLPRHLGQADRIDSIVAVRVVVCLECDGDVVFRRLASNVGGDRGGRSDDDLDQARKKLDIFRQRTAPLVDHYRRRGARIETIRVTADMTADDMRHRLERG
jgi:adenylate kinase family enzyme